MPDSITASQHQAAKVVGFMYIFALIPAMFAEFYVPGQLIDYGNAAVTARNIMANEGLFRAGIAANLIVFAGDVVMITALYVVLERVNRNLALLAVFFRLIETVLLVVVTLNDFAVLRLLSGADYLQALEPARLGAMARLAISAHNDAYRLGLLFFGFGSSVFGYLWLRSRYIPRILAAWGLFAAVLVGALMLTSIVFPGLLDVVTVAYYGGANFVFELGIGLWLLLKGIRQKDLRHVHGAQTTHR